MATNVGRANVAPMPKPNPRELLNKAGHYLRAHPEEVVRVVRGALGMRFGIPLDALRYVAKEFSGGKKAPKDVVIEPAPPGLRLAASVDAMGAAVRASLVIFVEELHVSADELRVVVRVADLTLKVLEKSDSPVAALINSGALDLSKPGNLVAFMPKKPALLVDAKDDRIVIDLLKIPQLASNPRIRKVLRVTTPVVGVRAIRTRDDHLDVHLKPMLSGLRSALAAARD